MITPKFWQAVRSDSLHKILPSHEPLQPAIEERPRPLHDLHLENSVNRNRVAHTHEVVENLVHWFDDKVFRLYPTWEDCIRTGVFSSPELERFFGPAPEGQKDPPGKANYARCVKTGIGRNIIAKMLAGTETEDSIRKALENFPMSDQRRRYEEAQAEKERHFRRLPWGVRQRQKLYKTLIPWPKSCTALDPKYLYKLNRAAGKPHSC